MSQAPGPSAALLRTPGGAAVPRFARFLLLAGLLASGAAALVNQVVWQRALARYLGGVESASSMVVVMVFMAGLSFGALAMSRRAGGVSSPFRALGALELGLAAANLGICLLLGLDLAASVAAFHRAAEGLHLPLRLVYGLSALLLLFPPCALMGASMPLASEAAERTLRFPACAGMAVMTLVLFHGASPWSNLVALATAASILAVGIARTRWRLLGAAATAVLGIGLTIGTRAAEPFMPKARRTYYTSEGVVGLDRDGNIFWNGLWHSSLSDGRSHVGTRNWLLAVCPGVLCPRPPRTALVIGLGTGITAATLARLDSIERVDVYDINPGLADLHAEHPEGTLRCLTHPKIHMIWRDARVGLALNPERYDLIQTQPLYLKQAGSSYLNSAEFLTLVRDHLTPDGCFCLYSNGHPAQALLLRQTARAVFPCTASCMNGYLLLLSLRPTLGVGDEAALRERFRRPGPFWDEVRQYEETATPESFLLFVDHPPLLWRYDDRLATDDHPLLEYLGLRWYRAKVEGPAWPEPLSPARREPPAGEVPRPK